MSLNRTKIEWVRSPDGSPGFTWNPVLGCTRGCDYCYARRLARRQRANCQRCYNFTPHLHWERLNEPMRRKKPAGVFVCSMGELFDPAFDGRERDTTTRVLLEMTAASVEHHRFYILTKRPERAVIGIVSWLRNSGVPQPHNWWVGTSVSTQAEAEERIPELLRLREHGDWPVLFASVEPILGLVDLSPWLGTIHEDQTGVTNTDQRIPEEMGVPFHDPWVRALDWVIVGAQTGRGAVAPERAGIENIVTECERVGVPVFVKDNARKQFPDAGWPQEMPE